MQKSELNSFISIANDILNNSNNTIEKLNAMSIIISAEQLSQLSEIKKGIYKILLPTLSSMSSNIEELINILPGQMMMINYDFDEEENENEDE